MTTVQQDVVANMVEIGLKKPEDFLKVKETLTRMGVAGKPDSQTGRRPLYQSVHILHKQGRYYLAHFKEMFALDGRTTTFEGDDIIRRNLIAKLLRDWGLVELINPTEDCKASGQSPWPVSLKVVKFQEKDAWDLREKYSVGKPKDQYNKSVRNPGFRMPPGCSTLNERQPAPGLTEVEDLSFLRR